MEMVQNLILIFFSGKSSVANLWAAIHQSLVHHWFSNFLLVKCFMLEKWYCFSNRTDIASQCAMWTPEHLASDKHNTLLKCAEFTHFLCVLHVLCLYGFIYIRIWCIDQFTTLCCYHKLNWRYAYYMSYSHRGSIHHFPFFLLSCCRVFTCYSDIFLWNFIFF
jgi:hypothetical protein